MQLPSLPLEDGCFLIDNSTLEGLTTCARYFEYSKLHKRVAAGSKASLNFGTALHLALEYRYRTYRDQPLDDAGVQEQSNILAKYFADNPVDEFEHRTLDYASNLLKRYNQKYRIEPFNLLLDSKGETLCETSMSIPLCDLTYKGTKIPVIFTGKIDMPVSINGKIFILDHKTDSMFWGPQKFLDEQRSSNQYRGYAWGFEKATGRTVDGFMINGIPTKQPPAKPKMGLDAWYQEWFVREQTYLSLYPQWREEWYAATCSQVEYIFWMQSRDSFPMTGRFVKACEKYGGCQYKDVCNAPADKRDEYLQSNLYQENTWSPLHKETTKQ